MYLIIFYGFVNSMLCTLLQFINTPESITFRNIPSGPELIVGIRGICSLLYLDVTDFSERYVTMNENEWVSNVNLYSN